VRAYAEFRRRLLLRQGVEPNPGPPGLATRLDHKEYVKTSAYSKKLKVIRDQKLIALSRANKYLTGSSFVDAQNFIGALVDVVGDVNPFTRQLFISCVSVIVSPSVTTLVTALATLGNLLTTGCLTGLGDFAGQIKLALSDPEFETIKRITRDYAKSSGFAAPVFNHVSTFAVACELAAWMLSCVERLYDYIRTGRFGFGDVVSRSIMEMNECLKLYKTIDFTVEHCRPRSFVMRSSKALKVFDSLLSDPKTSVRARLFVSMADELRVHMSNYNGSSSRPTPFGLMVIGSSRIGKTSYVSEYLRRVAFGAIGIRYDPDMSTVFQLDSNGRAEQMMSGHLHLDAGDLGAIALRFNAGELHPLMYLIDSTPRMIQKSALNEKAKEYVNILMVSATSNNLYYLARHDFTTATPVLARLHILKVTLIDSIWSNNGVLDPAAVPALRRGQINPDDVFRYEHHSVVPIVGYEPFEEHGINMYRKSYKPSEYVDFFRSVVRRHFAIDSDVRTTTEDMWANVNAPTGQVDYILPVFVGYLFCVIGYRAWCWFDSLDPLSISYYRLWYHHLTNPASRPYTSKMLVLVSGLRSVPWRITILGSIAIWIAKLRAVSPVLTGLSTSSSTWEPPPRREGYNYLPTGGLTRSIDDFANQLSPQVNVIAIRSGPQVVYYTSLMIPPFILVPAHAVNTVGRDACYSFPTGYRFNDTDGYCGPWTPLTMFAIAPSKDFALIMTLQPPSVKWHKYFMTSEPPLGLFPTSRVVTGYVDRKIVDIGARYGDAFSAYHNATARVITFKSDLGFGISGAPIITAGADGRGSVILGTASSRDFAAGINVGFFISLSDVLDLGKSMGQHGYLNLPHLSLHHEPKSAANVLTGSSDYSFTYLGTSSERRSTPIQTMAPSPFAPYFSDISSLVDPPREVVIGMRDGVYHSPVYDNLSMYIRNVPLIDLRGPVSRFVELIVQHQHFTAAIARARHVLYDDDFALLGDGDLIRPVAYNKASGPPFGGKKAEQFLPRPQIGYLPFFSDYLRQVEHDLELGCGCVQSRVFPKLGEVGPPGKPLRMVHCQGNPWYIVCRKLFGPIVVFIKAFEPLGVGVGFNTSDELCVRDYALKFTGKQVLDTDYSKWDKRLCPFLVKAVLHAFVDLLTQHEIYSKSTSSMAHTLVDLVAFPLSEWNCDYVVMSGGWISGTAYTSELNCLFNAFTCYYGLGEPCDFMDRAKIYYGDDALFEVRGETFPVFRDRVATLNQKVTLGTAKEDSLSDDVDFYDGAFLKRSVVVRDGKYFMPLPLSSLYRPLIWFEPGDDIGQQIESTASSVLRESLHHGPLVYDFVSCGLSRYFADQTHTFTPPSYHSALQWYVRDEASLDVWKHLF